MLSVELVISGFLAIVLVASLISIRAKLPYTITLVLVGVALVILTEILSKSGSGIFASSVRDIRAYFLNLTSSGDNGGGNLFVGLVVPPLIFEAMTHVSSKDFRLILRPALSLATIGVVIATLVGGLLLWYVAGLPFYTSFLFAAVISPTDTATVLELFRRIKVPSRLAALLDTEAALNDATGIMIFTIILTSLASSKLSFFRAGVEFAIIFGGGLAIGLAVAFVGEILTSLTTDSMTEIILTISAVYGSYALASTLGFSGLVAVTIVGLYFGNLTSRSSVRPSSRANIRTFWEVAAFLGNSVAFLFIGLRTNIFTLVNSSEYIAIAFLSVFVARAATVYPILTLFDKLAKSAERKIPLQWRNVAMLGGVRGALSIALAASISDSSVVSTSDADLILNMVLGVAFASIVLQSFSLSSYIRKGFRTEDSVDVTAAAAKATTAEEELRFDASVERVASSIESLRKLRQEKRITDEEFFRELEGSKSELERILDQAELDLPTSEILKERTKELYSSVAGYPIRVGKTILNDSAKNKAYKRRKKEDGANENDDDPSKNDKKTE